MCLGQRRQVFHRLPTRRREIGDSVWSGFFSRRRDRVGGVGPLVPLRGVEPRIQCLGVLQLAELRPGVSHQAARIEIVKILRDPSRSLQVDGA